MEGLEPILKKEGVFYTPPNQKGIECTIVLKEINEKFKFTQEYLNNSGKMLGFRAYHKLTGDPFYYSAKISKKIGNPEIHVILDDNEPIGYAQTLNSALNKAHEYMLGKILEEVLHPSDVYTNFLDTTKIGREQFKQAEINFKNKVNLSEEIKVNLPGHPAP